MQKNETPPRDAQGGAAEEEPRALFIRNTPDLRELRAVPRLRALARAAGLQDVTVTRSLLLLGLAVAEKDPGALARAAAVARGEG